MKREYKVFIVVRHLENIDILAFVALWSEQCSKYLTKI